MINNLLIFKKLSFSNKALFYLLISLLNVLLFTILYYIQDYFISNNIELSKKLGILNKNYNEKPEIISFLHYFWFSLITQTTVGYNNILNKNGQVLSFMKISYYPFKFLNIIQLISIFAISALFI